MAPGSARRLREPMVEETGDRRREQHEDVSTLTSPPPGIPAGAIAAEPRVQDMAEYIALRVRHDLEVFRLMKSANMSPTLYMKPSA